MEKKKCLKYKTGRSDGLVEESLKYGGVGMVDLLHQLFGMKKLYLNNGGRG